MEKHLHYYTSHSQFSEPTNKPAVSYCAQEDEVHYHQSEPAFPIGFAPGGYLMNDGSYVTYNDITNDQLSLVKGIYIGDNAVTGKHLFVTAESLLNTTTYKFRASDTTLSGDFQSSDFYTSTTNVAGQENKIFASRAPFATEGTINGGTVDWGGESNTEAWLYLIDKYVNVNLSDYPALEYASTHEGYLMGAGEGSLFARNHDAIWNAYTKLTGNSNDFYIWESSFNYQYSEDYSYQYSMWLYPINATPDSKHLGTMNRVCLLIAKS